MRLDRRAFLTGIVAVAAPAIVPAARLMTVKRTRIMSITIIVIAEAGTHPIQELLENARGLRPGDTLILRLPPVDLLRAVDLRT